MSSEHDDRDIDQTSPDLGPAFVAEEVFLDDWSMAEEFVERGGILVSEVNDPAPETIDDIHRSAWIDIDEVAEEASSVIIDLLDEQFADLPDRELDKSTMKALHKTVNEPPKRPGPPPAASDTSIEILEDIDDDTYLDAFEVTGISIIDVDTGEVVPTLESGFHLIEDTAAQRRNLAMTLEGLSAQIDLPRPWGAYIRELRDEIMGQPDPGYRASMLYVFGGLVRTMGGQSSKPPEIDIAAVAGPMRRADLLERLAARWGDADDEFFALLDELESHDEDASGDVAAIRRSSIARERLLDAGLDGRQRLRLRDLVVPPENLHGLAVVAIDAHASGMRNVAIDAWERAAQFAKGDVASATVTLAAWMLQGSRGLLEMGNALLDDGWNSRPLLLMMQREAVRTADRLQEARVLKRLVGLDVRLGKRLPNDAGSRVRLKAETAARLYRMANILDGISESELQGSDVEGMTSYDILHDVISLSAKNQLYLRTLEIHARRHGDGPMLERALISQAVAIEDPTIRAVIWERAADLGRRQGVDPEAVGDLLTRSLEAAPDCLPALISMGQHLISLGEHEQMLQLRRSRASGQERDLQVAWRRADLLERTQGDPVEILSLYRDARDDHPGSVHLFFCVERALSRLADWRGLRTLFESAAEPKGALHETLSAARFDVHQPRLAVETFLEGHAAAVSDALIKYVDRPLPPPRDSDSDARVDENALWRVIATEVSYDPGRTLGRLELLLQQSRGRSPTWRVRALVWYAHLVEHILGDAERALPAYREVFDRATGRFLRRWAVRGLLRTGDASWVARHLAEGGGPAWLDGPGDRISFRRRMAAELMGMSDDADLALDILEEVEVDEPIASAELAERATVLAIRARQWVRAIPWMFRCYPKHSHNALAEIARHLGAASDDAHEALRYIDQVDERTSIDPYVILCELELAYRARDWPRALDLIESGLATIAAGSIDFRAFLLEQAVLVAEWGTGSNERALTFLEDLWSLDQTVGSSPIFAATAFLRTYTRIKRKDALADHAGYVRKNFTPSVAEALLAEPLVFDEAKDGEGAAEWYASRADHVPAPIVPYYRFMAGVLRWMFGERDRTAVQELADATSQSDPTHRVGPFLLAIAYRDADMYTSCERQLAALRTPGHSRPVRDWVLVRELFHLAVTRNQTQEALERLRDDDSFGQFGWYSIAEELFARALRDPGVVDVLRERANDSDGARNLYLEIAEITDDRDALLALVADELPEAIGQAEMLTAAGEPVSVPRWDIATRHQQLGERLMGTTADAARDDVVAYLVDVEEELYGTPWCPLRTIGADLTPFDIDRGQQDVLVKRLATFGHSGMGAEARLVLARQLLKSGRREAAMALVPDVSRQGLISLAWSAFAFALDPYTTHERTAGWIFDLLGQRRASTNSVISAELDYEIGRFHEGIGEIDEAIRAVSKALAVSPRFLPGQVAAGRMLIQREDWLELASLWEAEMQYTEDEQALASVAFRLGYLWERRLSELPDSRKAAEDAYRRVLRVRPNHFPTLHALLAIAYDARDANAAAEHLQSIADACSDSALKSSYLCELGGLRETYLEDLAGACAAYQHALELDPSSVDALFGVFRTDEEQLTSVEVIRSRLRRGVTQRELSELCHHVFAASATQTQADDLLHDAMPSHYAWQLSRIVRGIESGLFESNAADELTKHYDDDTTRFIVECARRRVTDGHGRIEGLVDKARVIGTHPLNEGQLVRCMHHAARRGDLEALGVLAGVRARRTPEEVARATELTWLAITLMLREEHAEALDVVEQLLEQVPNFPVAVKTAKFAADIIRDWEAVVRWFTVDAGLTVVPDIASRDRLYASEVQRQHLGDFDAALQQLRTVLSGEPAHEQAFLKLRDILLTRRQYTELLEAYETRVKHTKSKDAKAELLNQMGDIALNHVGDRLAAIGYFGRAVDLRPKQPRRLRILSELYEAEQMWKQAIVCHRASAQLLDDPVVLVKLWRHVGHLQENRLQDFKRAKNAYARALKLDPDSTEVLLALARVCERLEDTADAIALLQKVVSISRDPRVLLDARVGIARLLSRQNEPAPLVLDAIRDVILHHPQHSASIEQAQKVLARAALPGIGADEFFQELTHAIITRHGPAALTSTFEMAVRLRHRDRAYCIAAIGKELGVSNKPMEEIVRQAARRRRWPTKPLPPDLTGGILPSGLVAPFVELLRRSHEAVAEGIDTTPAQLLIKRGSRLREPRNKATELAFKWPGLLRLELRDVHTSKGVPNGCAVHFDGGVRLVLDDRWFDVSDPTELTVALGMKLAAFSMGVGAWSHLDLDAQQSLFIAIVSNYVRGWAHAERSHLPSFVAYPRIQRWLGRKGERVAPYAIELSGRFGAAAIREQFALLREAERRIACLLVDDPGRALKTAGFLRAPDAGERPTWLFMLGPSAARIRRAVGVALPE